MRSREEVLKDYRKIEEHTVVSRLEIEILLDIRDLLKEISEKIRDDTVK